MTWRATGPWPQHALATASASPGEAARASLGRVPARLRRSRQAASASSDMTPARATAGSGATSATSDEQLVLTGARPATGTTVVRTSSGGEAERPKSSVRIARPFPADAGAIGANTINRLTSPRASLISLPKTRANLPETRLTTRLDTSALDCSPNDRHAEHR